MVHSILEKAIMKVQKYTFRFKLYACGVITGIALLLFGFFDTQLISLYLSENGSVGDVKLALKFGEEYLAIMMVGLLPFALSQSYTNTIRETGQTFVPMIAGIVAVVTNLILDIILIFGLGSIPAMGVEGVCNCYSYCQIRRVCNCGDMDTYSYR